MCEPLVVADEAADVIAQREGRGQVNRVERTQNGCSGLCSELANRIVERDQPDPVEDSVDILRRDTGSAAGTTELDLSDHARDAVRPALKFGTEGCCLVLCLYELDQRRAIDVEQLLAGSGYSRSSRSTSRASRKVMTLPFATGGGGRSVDRGARGDRSRRPPAISLASGSRERGASKATGSPRSVTSSVTPRSTIRRYRDRFCRSSRTPTRST